MSSDYSSEDVGTEAA